MMEKPELSEEIAIEKFVNFSEKTIPFLWLGDVMRLG